MSNIRSVVDITQEPLFNKCEQNVEQNIEVFSNNVNHS